MRKLMAISAASALLGYAAVYFVFFSKPALQPEPVEQIAEPAAEPVVLAHVVDVTDLDPLLDPPPAPPRGLPFDPTEPLDPPAPARAAAPIPPAAD
jgi:hypothetical protein